MPTSRRSLFKTIFAGAAAAVALGEGERLVSAAAQPAPQPAPREGAWHWFRIHPFQRAVDSTVVLATITARRSDGVYFYVALPIDTAEFTPEVVSSSLDNAMRTLETFRNCPCQLHVPCAEHVALLPDEADADEGEQVPIPTEYQA